MNIIPDERKVVLFDSDVYINCLKSEDIADIKRRESIKGIYAHASPWVILELMKYKDHKALNVLKQHCLDTIQGIRLMADPASQIYKGIYGRESVLCKSLLDDIITCLGLDETSIKRLNIPAKLAKTSRIFEDNFPTRVKVKLLRNVEAVKIKCATDLLNLCIILNHFENATERVDDALDFILQHFNPALTYYADLLMRKAPQKALKKDDLSHDQRDWHLIFYAGLKNFFIVTEEKNLLKIGNNVISLKNYKDEVLS